MDIFNIFMLTMIGLTSSATAASWNKALSEPFENTPKDGYTCEWAECNKPGPGPRLFHIRCNKEDAQSYECVYKANPHCCTAYNKNQAKYYRSLAKKAAVNRQTACDQDELTSDSICTEVDFPQILKRSPSGNKWCVEFAGNERAKRDVANETQEQNECVAPAGAAVNVFDHNKLGLIGFLLIAFMTLALW